MNNAIVSLCWFLAAFSCCSAILCDTCNHEQCPEAVNCTAGLVLDSCQCCQVCAIPEGGPCSTLEVNLCADERVCLPDGGLFSNSITGKCLAITDCFATGCDIIENECHCGYSNSCPTKLYQFEDIIGCEEFKSDVNENQTHCNTLEPLALCEDGQICISEDGKSTDGTCQDISPCINYGCEVVGGECLCRFSNSCPLKVFRYLSMDTCQAGLAASICQDVQCTPEPSCPEGTYYEQGAPAVGECCPTGVCVCDSSLCSLEPDCPDGAQALLVISANDTEEACCDVYQCKQVECEFEGRMIENHDVVKPNACTTCSCLDGELVCATLQCSPPQCNENEELVLNDGDCCPYCHPLPIIDGPRTSSCEQEKDSINENNPCHLCFCQDGILACTEQLCGIPECKNPVQLPGVCCPVCETQETDSPTTLSENTQEPSTTGISSKTTPNPDDESTELVTDSETTVDSVLIIDLFPVAPCTRRGRYRSPVNPCLTCECVNGLENCVDQSNLCGDMVCVDPIKIEGQCCPLCRDSSVKPTEFLTPAPTTAAPDVIPSVTLTVLVEASLEDMKGNQENVIREIGKEVEGHGYTLIQMKAIAYGKTQMELVIVIKGSPVLSEEDLVKLLTDRVSAVMAGDAATLITTTTTQKTFESIVMLKNSIIIVSVLVVVIIVSLAGILAVVMMLLRQRRRYSKNIVRV